MILNSAPFSLFIDFASTAFALAVRQMEKLMPVPTGRFASVNSRRAGAVEYVFTRRNWLKVSRIEAGGVMAFVVKVRFAWQRSHKKLIRETMNLSRLAVEPGVPVPLFVRVARPKPALAGIGLSAGKLFRESAVPFSLVVLWEKIVGGQAFYGSHGANLTLPMLHAQGCR